MNVSLNWLKEYVDLDDSVTVKEIVDKITMTGTKVEKYEMFGNKTKLVYTARVESISKHPSDDKLSVLKLDLKDKHLIAVAKIPDIEVGDIIPVALPGAQIIGKEVKEGMVNGVNSECMVCHVLDLGLSKDMPWVKPSGLLVFPKDVEIGVDINDILGLDDYIIEFEITPNRPDCLSIEGIANELALTFNKPCKSLWQYKEENFERCDSVEDISVEIKTDNCKRYTATVAKDVIVKESPYDMQLKLIKCGIRPINNIVDITNYVMLEVGEPLHAFDKKFFDTNKVVIRQANDGEQIETLDGILRTLDNTNMVITNGEKTVAIAGIMGGELSGIHDDTNEIVLESANFVRGNIRNTSKKIGLRTDASSRYEKGLPQELTVHALNRVCDLINSTNSGKCVNKIVDCYPVKQKEIQIKIDYKKLNKIIGTDISNEEIDRMLALTKIKVKDGVAYIPYFREDVELVEDLSEEVARIYGYDKLKSTLPDTITTFGEKTKVQKMEDKVKELSIAEGYNEIYTYTFFDKEVLKKVGITEDMEEYNCVKIKNPLSKDFEYMRTTTVPHMLDALERNNTRKNKDVRLFELGKVFKDADNIKKNELVREELVLTLGLYDDVSTYYDIKENVENILNYYNILDNEYRILRIENSKIYHPGMSAKITIGEDLIARFGKLNPLTCQNYILPSNTYIAEINFEMLKKYQRREIKFKELPKFPAVERDISFVISSDVLSFEIINALKNVTYVENVELFDVYEGKQIEAGKKSMAYRIFLRSQDKTLNEDEIKASMDKILNILSEKFNAQIRE